MRCHAIALVSLLLSLSGHALAQNTTSSNDDALAAGAESPELAALRTAESEIFRAGRPLVEIGAQLPAVVAEMGDAEQEEHEDVAWTEGLALPDLPVRWDHRVVTFVEFFRDDARGRSIMSSWLRREPRYAALVQSELRAAELPLDLLYVAMIESGFDPRARSSASAVGMWQFVGGTGDEYGLRRDHWMDQRMSPEASTRAAAHYLRDLYQRFGSWELALAAYNMGYNALLRSIRKYNTNDFWVLSRLEDALPFETTVYVAKIMACAIIAKNPARFGFGDVTRDAPLTTVNVEVPGGTATEAVARAVGISVADFSALNPEFLRSHTSPGDTRSVVRIPAASASVFERAWARSENRRTPHRAYAVRFGETLSDIADAFATNVTTLRRLNELEERETIGAGFSMLVPNVERTRVASATPPIATVPATRFEHPGRTRVFYRVIEGDSSRAIGRFFGVTMDELRRWNGIDPSASLQRGMILQLFIANAFDMSRAALLTENQVRLLVVGSAEFYEHHESQRGRVRSRYRVRDGETVASIARRFELSAASLARINRFSERTALETGREITVYAPRGVDVNASPRSATAAAAPANDNSAAPAPVLGAPEAASDAAPSPADAPASAPESESASAPGLQPAPGPSTGSAPPASTGEATPAGAATRSSASPVSAHTLPAAPAPAPSRRRARRAN
ncbi:MAG: transglycosylase SLT domain-containing protein [Sandaracinaceae bacterium]|nr:transglycosylase SLT domain-containing protein [Sandaracinaceae bacterium]